MKKYYFTNKPLKTQLSITFLQIIGFSLIATIITYALAIVVFLYQENKSILPANYYEKQVPIIEEYISENNSGILSLSAKNSLEKIVPEEGIKYQVIDKNGQFCYGTINDKIIRNGRELSYKINTTGNYKGEFIRYIPILDNKEDTTVQGAVLLIYNIQMTYVNDASRMGYSTLFTVIIFSPFLYVIFFTFLFSRRITNSINIPLKMLIDASNKIVEKNLDFDISYESDNELGQLCNAFTKMKDELKLSLEYQWKLEQERIDTIQALAHDLKTPISNLLIYAESLLHTENKDSDRMQRYLKVIYENSERSAQLVSQMQYSSVLEHEGSKMQLVQMNITEFMKTKINEYELKASQKNINIFYTKYNFKTENFYADIEKVERILDNVVSNALTYTPNNGEINISVQLNQDKIHYTVQDSGTGFTKKDLENGTKRFYRGDDTRNSSTGNSGLGLYIAKQLLEKMEGSLSLSNNRKGGAKVEFWHKIYYQTELSKQKIEDMLI